MGLIDFFTSFVLGLLTPLTAVCVLPLYPGFLAYLASQFKAEGEKEQKRAYALFGLLVTLGVIIFMFLLGIIFTTFLQVSLTKVIGIISPIAFGILALISIFLIFDLDIGRFLPKAKTKLTKRPLLNAIMYGFFFGAIVIPCNPAFIGAFFARALLIQSPVASVLNFIFFGVGLGFPLLLFSLLSSKWSTAIIGFATARKTWINRIAGVIMLLIALYYLVFVFRVFG
jgi:cytochrome c-type biogenesis protein